MQWAASRVACSPRNASFVGNRRVNGRLDIDFASCTDVGLRRSHNQDSHVVLPAADSEQWRQRGHVFLVADGMGARRGRTRE